MNFKEWYKNKYFKSDYNFKESTKNYIFIQNNYNEDNTNSMNSLIDTYLELGSLEKNLIREIIEDIYYKNNSMEFLMESHQHDSKLIEIKEQSDESKK